MPFLASLQVIFSTFAHGDDLALMQSPCSRSGRTSARANLQQSSLSRGGVLFKRPDAPCLEGERGAPTAVSESEINDGGSMLDAEMAVPSV